MAIKNFGQLGLGRGKAHKSVWLFGGPNYKNVYKQARNVFSNVILERVEVNKLPNTPPNAHYNFLCLGLIGMHKDIKYLYTVLYLQDPIGTFTGRSLWKTIGLVNEKRACVAKSKNSEELPIFTLKRGAGVREGR